MNDQPTPPPHGSMPEPEEPMPELLDTLCVVPSEFVAQVTTEQEPRSALVDLRTTERQALLPPSDLQLDALLRTEFERLGSELGRRLDELSARLDRESRAEETREKVVDRLHAELQEYKNDLLLRVMKPIFLDLIQLHDDLGKRAEALGDERIGTILAEYQQAIEDILYRQGVEPFEQDDGPFDPRKQRAVSTVPTEDPGQNKRIAARVRKGFVSGDKIIRPEMVTVYAVKRI